MSSGWAMVCITAVYVVATIFICYYNAQSSKASIKQIDEMKKQLSEMKNQETERNRPRITIEIIYTSKCFFGFRLRNSGGSIAKNVSLELSDEFIDALPTPQFINLLKKQRGKKCIIAVNGYYDIYFGDNQYLKLEKKPHAIGTITYDQFDDKLAPYSEDFDIDLENYSTMFSVDGYEEKQLKLIKQQNQYIHNIEEQLVELNEGIKETRLDSSREYTN